MTTAAEKRHLAYIASLPCCVCGRRPVEVHHVRAYGEKRKHSKTIPLCYDHHRGANGIHTLGKKAWREICGYEEEYLRIMAGV